MTQQEPDPILQFLEGKDWTSPTTIAKAIRPGLDSRWASPKCKRLLKAKLLRRNSRGQYKLSKLGVEDQAQKRSEVSPGEEVPKTTSKSREVELLLDIQDQLGQFVSALQDVLRLAKNQTENSVGFKKEKPTTSKIPKGCSFAEIVTHLQQRGFVTRKSWEGNCVVFFSTDNVPWSGSNYRARSLFRYNFTLKDLKADDWIALPYFWRGPRDNFLPFKKNDPVLNQLTRLINSDDPWRDYDRRYKIEGIINQMDLTRDCTEEVLAERIKEWKETLSNMI